MQAHEYVPVQATADAMATSDLAGFGGAAWELLAHFALSFAIANHFPLRRFLAKRHQECDSNAADAVSGKGLTMTPGMSHVVAQYFMFMRRFHVYADVSHIPGHLTIEPFRTNTHSWRCHPRCQLTTEP